MVTAFQRQQSSARLFYLRLHLCPHLGHRQAMAPATAALAGPLMEGLVELLEGSTFDDFADNYTGKGFVFGPYINFLGTGFIGIAAAMNTVRVKGKFNA